MMSIAIDRQFAAIGRDRRTGTVQKPADESNHLLRRGWSGRMGLHITANSLTWRAKRVLQKCRGYDAADRTPAPETELVSRSRLHRTYRALADMELRSDMITSEPPFGQSRDGLPGTPRLAGRDI
jgi:hypothetical protein